MTATGLKPRFPLSEEQLEISGSKRANVSCPKPVREAAQGVQVLPPRRDSSAAPAKVAVEALEELVDGKTFSIRTVHFIDSNMDNGMASGRRPRLARDGGAASCRTCRGSRAARGQQAIGKPVCTTDRLP